MQFHEILMHEKYQVAIFYIAKVMANVKVFRGTGGGAVGLGGQTDGLTVRNDQGRHC